jgi:hypothetical protein
LRCLSHDGASEWLAQGEIKEIDREAISPEELAALGCLRVGHWGGLRVSAGSAQEARPEEARERDRSQGPLDDEGRGSAA